MRGPNYLDLVALLFICVLVVAGVFYAFGVAFECREADERLTSIPLKSISCDEVISLYDACYENGVQDYDINKCRERLYPVIMKCFGAGSVVEAMK